MRGDPRRRAGALFEVRESHDNGGDEKLENDRWTMAVVEMRSHQEYEVTTWMGCPF
jgi:hypothetical protein